MFAPTVRVRSPALMFCVYLFFMQSATVVGFLTNLPDLHIHVSLNGSDTNDGLHLRSPWKSFNKALSMTYNASNAGRNIIIEMHAGHYEFEHGVSIRRHVAKYVTIRPTNNGRDEVHITGGKRIPSSSFKPVSDQHILARLKPSARQHVKVVHLPDVGISNYGNLTQYGAWGFRKPLLEPYYNGVPLRETRFPKQGYVNIVGTPDGINGTRFKFGGNIPTSWTSERELWTYGFWHFPWYDKAVKVAKLDRTHNIVTLASSPQYGIWNDGQYGNKSATVGHGGYFRFTNILAELDEPGEYYLDRATGNMYIWAPNSDGSVHTTDYVEVSMANRCIQFGSHVKDYMLQDLTVETCRDIGIAGQDNKHIDIRRVEVRNTGNKGIAFFGDNRNVRMFNCMIHDTVGGIYIQGGDRQNLTWSGNLVQNTEITRFSRVGITGNYGVTVAGVGITVNQNHIYNGSQLGINYMGNDHHIFRNDIHDVCLDIGDCAAIRADGDWTSFGNKLINNYIHHILPPFVPAYEVRGVLLDEQSSGHSVNYNVFYDNEIHVAIEGGRYNTVAGNIMYNATKYSMTVDGRGITHHYDKILYRKLHAVPYNSSRWTTKYHMLKNFDSHNNSLPKGNVITRQVVYNKDPYIEFIHGRTDWLASQKYYFLANNIYSEGPSDHIDIDHGDFRMQCHTQEVAHRLGIPQPQTPNSVGIVENYGPKYKQKAPVKITLLSGACPTQAPVTDIPTQAYLPDGSAPNHLINVSREGCWLKVTQCSDNPGGVGTYRDMHGERFDHAAESQENCFRQAVFEWQYCGAHPGETVAAIFGPTGAMTYAGDGCYRASYGCPKHGGPADGHVVPGNITRDEFAEYLYGAATNESSCLARALIQWKHCGSHKNHPVTYIYRPTGAVRTAGAGCWIHTDYCMMNKTMVTFYDAWGAANAHTDDNEQTCFQRAEYFWRYCGDDLDNPVTAQYRPNASSYTYPPPEA